MAPIIVNIVEVMGIDIRPKIVIDFSLIVKKSTFEDSLS